MTTEKKPKITIIGTGLAGSFLAVLLAQRGYRIEIYEKLSQVDICDVASKRSYNIVLFGFGTQLLQQANLWDDIKPHVLTLEGTVTHVANALPITSFADNKKMPYFTISRARLADILLKKAAKSDSVKIHYNTQLLAIDRHTKSITVQNTKTKDLTIIPYEVIVGADGANSSVRPFMQQGQQTDHKQEYASWIYKQFMLTPEMIDKLGLRKNFVHIWTQKNSFITMHPHNSNSFSAMLVYPKTEDGTQMLGSAAEIKTFFKKNFKEFLPIVDNVGEQILSNPAGNFSTIYTSPWYYKNFITLIGDAAHGFYPFFGQGTTAAFSDCVQLVELLEKHREDMSIVFKQYQEKRKKHTDALGDLSKEVIHKYLRNKKADPEAILDKLESLAYHHFPKVVHPPLSEVIITDPMHAFNHKQQSLKQRKIAKVLGISLFVAIVTGIVTAYEATKKKNN